MYFSQLLAPSENVEWGYWAQKHAIILPDNPLEKFYTNSGPFKLSEHWAWKRRIFNFSKWICKRRRQVYFLLEPILLCLTYFYCQLQKKAPKSDNFRDPKFLCCPKFWWNCLENTNHEKSYKFSNSKHLTFMYRPNFISIFF